MTALLSVTLLLSDGAYRHSADDRGGSCTARGVRGIGQLTRHPGQPGNHKSGRGADARVQAGRVYERQG